MFVIFAHFAAKAQCGKLSKNGVQALLTQNDFTFNNEIFDDQAPISIPKVRFLAGAATSAALSFPTGVGSISVLAGVPNTVTVQAVDVNGAVQTSGGNLLVLRVENQSQNLPGLPIIQTMTDNGDGSYTAQYTVSQTGTVNISVELMKQGGLYGEYFSNTSLSGAPDMTRIDNSINFNWNSGTIFNSIGDNVSIRWKGMIRPPTTEQYTFSIQVDDFSKFYIDNQLLMNIVSWGQTTLATISLQMNTYYDLLLTFVEGAGGAYIRLFWETPTISTQIIPSTYIWYPEQVQGLTSIPSKSNIVSLSLNVIAGAIYTITMQSRDSNSNVFDAKSDVYSVELLRSDSGGSQQFIATGVYQSTSAGLYKAFLTPTVAGQFIMTVQMANLYTAIFPSVSKVIIGSPSTVTISSDPQKCAIKTFTTAHIAGQLYRMIIQSNDVDSNPLDSTFDVYSVQLTRTDSGGSQQLTTTAVYQSASGGPYQALLAPAVAGRYQMTVNIQNAYTTAYPSLSTEIIGSPFTVTVDSDPELCKIQTFTTAHIAGELYTLTIQSRDGNGNPLDSTFDVYTVQLTRTDGGGTQQLTTTAVYQPASGGIYKAFLTPTIAGRYKMTVSIANAYTTTYPSISTNIIGSPFFLTVYPGLVDPNLCYSDVPLLSIQTANVAFTYKIYFVDLYGNLHYQTMIDDALTVVVKADYKNHDDWSSPIGVADFADWQSVYGTSILVTAIDKNDGTMIGSMTIQRAGTYTLSITVGGIHIKGSPHSYFKIKPASLHAPYCVPVDIVETMYAGYDYKFLIQGRDMYHNNISNIFENAVGIDYSISYTLLSNSKVTVDAQISNDINPGVYLVKVTLAKLLEAGDYDLKILLRGLEVPSPAILVKPCTNTIAFDLGILPGAGKTVQLLTLNYTIGFISEQIQLPIIPYYCEKEKSHILMSATLTFPDGLQQELDEAVLKTFGITLFPIGKNPYLKVFSQNKTLGGLTFQIKVIVTVFGDTTFDNTSLVTILFQKSPLAHPFQQLISKEPPRFDTKQNSKKILPIFEDETGAQNFIPIVISCNLEWASALPAIIGEDEGRKFTINVNLGSSLTFIRFNQTQRAFQLVPQLIRIEKEAFKVQIEIVSQNGISSLYDLEINYMCPQNANSKPLNTYQYRYDENPPVPYIQKISPYGEVKIRFNTTMEPIASLNATEIYNPGRKLQEIVIGEVLGQPTTTFTNFTSIHNGTVRINGTDYPSFSVAIQPNDPEDACARQLDFIWQCVDFNPDELTLQLNFLSPECVSGSTNEGDQLLVTFYDQRIFTDSQKKLVWPETIIKANIKRQMYPYRRVQATLEAIGGSALALILSASIFSAVLNIFLQAGLNKLIRILKNLQIIVHILLIQVYLVPHAEAFLLNIMVFKVFDLSSILKKIFDVEENQAVDIRFQSLGYETSDAILNLGPIFAGIVLLPALIILILIFSRHCCYDQVKNFLQKQIENIYFNGIIQYVEGTMVIILVCCTINIYQVYKGEANQSLSYYFAICAISIIFLYMITLIWYLHRKFDQLNKEPVKSRVGAAYTHFAVSKDKAGLSVLVFLLLEFGRKIALAFVITFAQSTIVVQLTFMNFSSIILLFYVGRFRPFASDLENMLELLNEYTILVLYCIAITQTDFVPKMAGRNAMGWLIIAIISINILLNFGSILVQDLFTLYRKIKLWQLKRIWIKKIQLYREKKLRINLYRKEKIAQYWKNLAQESDKPSKNLEHDSSLRGELSSKNDSSSQSESSLSKEMTLTEKNELVIKPKVKSSFESGGSKTSEMHLLIDAKSKLATGRTNRNALVAPLSQPIVQRLNETSYEVKVEDFEEEEKQLIVTPKMLLALYDEELVKLQDPFYPGGGHYPPYGPRITYTEQFRDRHLPFQTQRMRYCNLLMQKYYKKLGDKILSGGPI